jgi:transposase
VPGTESNSRLGGEASTSRSIGLVSARRRYGWVNALHVVLAELLHNNQLRSVYHGDHGLRTLKELARSYLTITQDLSPVMTRVKAIYRSWAIPCTCKQVYAPRHRTEWLAKISEPGVRRRAEFYYQQLDALRTVRQQVRRELLAESKKHPAWKRLCGIPPIGRIRAAELLGILQTPHRFRGKRQLGTYGGVGMSPVLELQMIS